MLCVPAEKKLRDSQVAAAAVAAAALPTPDTSSTGLTDSQARSYLAKYPDLQNAFGSDLEQAKSHWISHGKGEGRTWESAGVPETLSTGLSPNDCSCKRVKFLIRQNIKDIMRKSQEKLKINIAEKTFTCVASNGITPATCPWDT